MALVCQLWIFPALNQLTEVQEYLIEIARQPFDLSKGPLLRVSLLRLAAHGAYYTPDDPPHRLRHGLSEGVFFRELAALYMAIAAGQPDPWPSFRSSMRTLQSGSGNGCKENHWKDNWLTGRTTWPVRRPSWNFRAIMPAPTHAKILRANGITLPCLPPSRQLSIP